ncbi:hypothetical protein QAD02_001009 [Eretmocerus hayati]|uniref:Uncharacterized protein n=1 Tax=Eretmocerus hayati TaxID=131215 RepID=A0ACC2NJN0_9HYME|nr:hypothetical protein QAD02_001009 [Eretmocerus hayati]
MPPKKTVSKNSRHSKEQLGYRELVEKTVINDEKWRCIITILIETHESQMRYISILNDTCKTGYRKAIRAINYENILKEITTPVEIHQTSSDRTIYDDQLHEWLRSELLGPTETDQKNNTHRQGHHLQDVKLKSILILWAVRQARLESLSRREAELALARERELEILAMKDEAAPRAGSARKHNSRLRKRGEDWRDIVYVDDAPVRGPDLYILLTGFYDPSLPVELIKIGLPLRCILRLEINLDDNYGESILGVTNLSSSDGSVSLPSTTFRPSQASTYAAGDSSRQLKFWSSFDGTGCNSVAIRCFKPTWDTETIPSKMYDEVSYMMYDVHATIEEHEAYLRAMKVYQMYEPRELIDSTMASYEDRLIKLPDGLCDSVSVVLDALLSQLEENLEKKVNDNSVPSTSSQSTGVSKSSKQQERVHRIEGESDAYSSRESISSVQTRLEAKLAQLNSKYGLFGLSHQQNTELERIEDRPMRQELELLLHGDSLRLDLYRALTGRSKFEDCLKEMIERLTKRLPEEPIVGRAWKTVDQRELEICQLHMPGVYECCRREGLDRLKSEHLLNLLGLRKLLRLLSDQTLIRREEKPSQHRGKFGESHIKTHTMNEDRGKTCRMHNETNQFERSASIISSSTRSISHQCGPEHRAIHHQNSSCIRESVDVGNMLRSFENCAALFELVDARESLGLEYNLQKQQYHTKSHQQRISLEGFEHAELISSSAFPQIIRDCIGMYEQVVVQHFEPTDSLLLLFQHEVSRPGNFSEIQRVYSIRTPVCLRDFCDYVTAEESEWLEKIRKLGENSAEGDLAGRCRRKMLASVNGIDGGNNELPSGMQSKATLLPADLQEKPSPQISSSKRNSLAKKSKSSINAQTSHSSTNSSCGPTQSNYEFVGYDVGEGQRVQLIHHRKVYKACDGMILKFERDSWLFEHENWIHIKATSGVWDLHYFEHFPDGTRHHFRLAHAEDASISFTKKINMCGMVKSNEMLYQITIHWPTGLTVRPMEYENAEYPFYVYQRYSSIEATSNEIESHRKYLPNGDIVKFHKDGSIIVLRPNGTIITDIEFVTSPDGCYLKERCYGEFESAQPSRKNSSLNQTWSLASFRGAEEDSMGSLNYTVLEPDGRQYRIYGSEEYIVELEQIRIRVMEEYSSREKFVRRADGTDMLFTDDAELIIDFPDGTRTLMGCRIDDEDFKLLLDTDDDFDVYSVDVNNHNSSYVSLSIYTKAEHPNYATVERDSDERCLLSFGSSTLPKLNLTPKATGEILLPEDRARLQLTETEVCFSRLSNCQSPRCSLPTSLATFNPLESIATPMFTFIDKSKKISLARSSNGLDMQDTLNGDDDGNIELCCCCRDEEFELSAKVRRHEGLRMFAVSRDGEAHEYLERSMVNEVEEKMMDEENSSLVVRQINDRPEVEYRLHLRPLSGLRIPRAFPRFKYTYDQKDDNAEDTNEKCDESWKEPLLPRDYYCNKETTAAVSKAIGRCNLLLKSQVLIARLFEDVGRETENCLVSMQKALLAMGVRKEARGNVTAMCDCRGDTETQLRDIVLEKDKTIDLEIYEAGKRYLKDMKVARDEERTRLMIDSTYDRKLGQNKCSRSNDE